MTKQKTPKMPARLIFPYFAFRGHVFELWAEGVNWWLANDTFELAHDDFCPPLTAVEISKIDGAVRDWYA